MKNSFDKERLLQIFIILICLIILTLRFSPECSNAQTPCLPDKPPLIQSPVSPQFNAWRQYKNVSVLIFDRQSGATPDDEFNAIDASIRDWNNVSVSGCSNVTFGNATRANRAWDGTETVPNDSMYVIRTTDRSGQLFAIYASYGLRAALLYMHSDYNLNTRDRAHRIDNLAKHEAGHSFGVGNGDFSDPPSIYAENSFTGPRNIYVITECDIAAHRRVYCPATPTPTPSPTPIQPSCPFAFPRTGSSCPAGSIPDSTNGIYCCPIFIAGGCNGAPIGSPPSCSSGFVLSGVVCQRSTAFANSCNRFGGYDFESCGCLGDCAINSSCSPIVVDVSGNGFTLTDALNGVNFDVDANGTAERRAWTSAGSDDAWLVLDRNGNGTIDGGREMFGSVTSQPPPPAGVEMNGFNALAEYDEAGFGGNTDGQITNQDAVFNRLRLWQDANHNGISEAGELHTLPELGLRKIDLDYRESRRTDQYGNQFKYRSKVRDAQDAQLGRWAWDVFLVQ